ncbi:hypothetical protein PIB30_091326, partial [Stylosanthes scabra]|nr:hypothetical protein [Stylosanthes scabra]
MKKVMRNQFVPASYRDKFLERLNILKQGSKSIKEYQMKLLNLMIKANVEKGPNALIRFSLRTDEEVDLVIYWHVHHPDIHLMELFTILVDVAERSSSSYANDTQSTDPTRGLIRDVMIDLNMILEGSMNASNSAGTWVKWVQWKKRWKATKERLLQSTQRLNPSLWILFSLMKRSIRLLYPKQK